MKISIIKDIFYGKRGHSETIKESEEYWNLIDQAAKISEELIKGLTEKQKELLNKLEHTEMGLESEAAFSHFTEGFKIGVLMGIECMDE